jgi:hypothetical protein
MAVPVADNQTHQSTRNRPGKTERVDESSDRKDDTREIRQGAASCPT